MSDEIETNDQLVLIVGESGTGKSASLKDIPNQERWFYFNAEAGKRLPFKNKYNNIRITDPYDIWTYMDELISNPDASDGAILDTITFCMDMFESMYIRTATNTQKAWGDFADFPRVLLQQKVVQYGKPVLILAHTLATYDEKAMEFKSSVPIKGSLKNQGIEAYFSTVVACKKMPLKELEPYKSDLLNITEDDEILGFKHVFQTRLTKTTTGERIRSPMGLFSREETYMDNDANLLLKRLHDFYA